MLGQKLYGAAVSFYETYSNQLTSEQMEKLGLNPANDYQLKGGSCSDSTSTNDPAEQMTFHTLKVQTWIQLIEYYRFFIRQFVWWVATRFSTPSSAFWPGSIAWSCVDRIRCLSSVI